jgi:hypothetical protein
MKFHDVNNLGRTEQTQKECHPSNFADLAPGLTIFISFGVERSNRDQAMVPSLPKKRAALYPGALEIVKPSKPPWAYYIHFLQSQNVQAKPCDGILASQKRAALNQQGSRKRKSW